MSESTESPTEPSGPKLLEPPSSELTEPFWEATRRRELLVQWCWSCEHPIFYPRDSCPTCLSDDLEWRPSAGTGAVYAVSVQHRAGPGRDETDGPYAVALVDLDDGIRLMTNVVGVDPTEVVVGQAVKVHWHPISDGRNLPFFEPA